MALTVKIRKESCFSLSRLPSKILRSVSAHYFTTYPPCHDRCQRKVFGARSSALEWDQRAGCLVWARRPAGVAWLAPWVRWPGQGIQGLACPAPGGSGACLACGGGAWRGTGFSGQRSRKTCFAEQEHFLAKNTNVFEKSSALSFLQISCNDLARIW